MMNKNTNEITVAVSNLFINAYTKLPRCDQSKVMSFVNKFIQNPTLPGYKYETIRNAKDKRLRSLRVDDSCRCILLKPDGGSIYMLLWVAKHDDAYEWACNRRCEIDPNTGGLQVVIVPEIEAKEPTKEVGAKEILPDTQATSKEKTINTADNNAKEFPLGSINDEDFAILGIHKDLYQRIRSIRDDVELENLKEYLSPNSYEALAMFLTGESLSDVLNTYGKDKNNELADEGEEKIEPLGSSDKQVLEKEKESGRDSSSESDFSLANREPSEFSDEELVRALNNPYTLAQFTVNPDEKELIEMLNAPLEKWRVFLHPEQRKLVEHDWNGSVRVLGGAGTGKTVAALHRAKWLAANRCQKNDKILFTTFTSTLAVDLKRQLASICTDEELAKIEVVNLDRWVIDFLRRNSYDYTIIYSDKKSDDLWKQACSVLDENSPVKDFPLSFFREEWERVIQPQEVMTLGEYFKAVRKGRGKSITRKERKAIWPVMEEFRIILNERKERQPADAMREARQFIEKNISHTQYKSIIVDETQDMSAQALRLLRALTPVGKNDLFLVGDPHQRIYGQPISLANCGINIIGRGKKLRLNYRTTEEIRKTAVEFLGDGLTDDLDGQTDSLGPYISLTHGVLPTKEHFQSFAEVVLAIEKQVAAFKGVEDYALRNICLTVRTNTQVKDLDQAVSARGIQTYALSAENPDAPEVDGIRISTMHRVKGLEFDVIFLIMRKTDLNQHYEDEVRNEQEKSLRYVAATRAIKGLFIYTY